MINKSFYISWLKFSLTIFFMFSLVSCSGSGSEDWPIMRADTLWVELEKAGKEGTPDEKQTSVTGDYPSPAKPPFEPDQISMSDVRVTLDEAERDLPYHAENIAAAVAHFEASPAEDRALNWRGVEIEISRLNELVTRLRDLDHKLKGNQDFINEQRLTGVLLDRAINLIPEQPAGLMHITL